MERRKFLVGMGSLAAGSAAAMGTGAMSITQSNRNVDVNIVADDQGAIGVKDVSSGDFIKQSNGELGIDFARGTGDGVSVGAKIELGDVNVQGPDLAKDWGYTGTPAFKIVNQAPAETYDITFTYELDNSANLNSNGSALAFYNFKNTHYSPLRVFDGSPEAVSGQSGVYEQSDFLDQYSGLSPGEAIDMAVAVNTDFLNSDTSEDISGSLTISATPH
ncbi:MULTISPECIES: hypothetical protein [Halorubrum]|nr:MULTISPECIES: hypothetical protein [Halorubrum]